MNKKFIFFILILALINLGLGCQKNGSSYNQPRRIEDNKKDAETFFKFIISDPIPSEVRFVEGYGETSQGHNIYLKFIASDKFVKKMIAMHKYNESSCKEQDYKTLFFPPEDYLKNMSFWNASSILKNQNIKCYKKSGYANRWTSNAEGEFAIKELENDSETKEKYWQVYFHEIGI
jgi:hypothetical protein